MMTSDNQPLAVLVWCRPTQKGRSLKRAKPQQLPDGIVPATLRDNDTTAQKNRAGRWPLAVCNKPVGAIVFLTDNARGGAARAAKSSIAGGR